MKVKIRDKWVSCSFSSFISKDTVCVTFADGSSYRTHISNVKKSENYIDFSINSDNYQNIVLFLKYATPMDLNRLLSKLPDVRRRILKAIVAMESVIVSSIVQIKYKKSFIYAKVVNIDDDAYNVKILGKNKTLTVTREEIVANLGILDSQKFKRLNLKIFKRN